MTESGLHLTTAAVRKQDYSHECGEPWIEHFRKRSSRFRGGLWPPFRWNCEWRRSV